MGDQQSKANEMLEFHLRQLDKLLINMGERVQKEANLPKPKRISTQIDIYYYEFPNEPMWIQYYIDIDFHYEDKKIRCYAYSIDPLPYQIRCYNHQNEEESFELLNPSQNSSFIERTISAILGAYNILNPGALKVTNYIPTHIRVDAYTDPNQPEKNLERTDEDKIFRNSNKYNIGKSSIEIASLKY